MKPSADGVYGVLPDGASTTANSDLVARTSGYNPTPSAPTYNGPFANVSIGGQSFSVFLAFILLLIVAKYATESKYIPGTPSVIKVNWANMIIVGAMALCFIVAGKVIFNIVRLPAITPFFNAA